MAEETAEEVLGTLVGVAVLFIVLDTFFLFLRFISRSVIKKVTVGADDILMYPGYALNIGLCITAILLAKYQTRGNIPARAAFDSPIYLDDVITPSSKALFAELPLLYLGAMLPKLSLLATYLRIFPSRLVHIAIYLTMAAIFVSSVIFTFVGMFACHPVESFWNHFIPGSYCIDLGLYYRLNTPFILAFDVITLVIPIKPLWSLHAPKAKKLGLIFVFLTGGLGLFGCIGRWYTQLKYQTEVFIPLNTSIVTSWIVVEPSCYLIAACLPPCNAIVMSIVRNKKIRSLFSLDRYSFFGLTGRTTNRTANTTPAQNARGGTFYFGSSGARSGFAHLDDAESQPKEGVRTSHIKRPSIGAGQTNSDEEGIPLRTLPTARSKAEPSYGRHAQHFGST